MAINRASFKNPFSKNNIPAWFCPTCKTGHLQGDKTKIKTYESATSLSYRGDRDWEPEWISGVFLGLLKCNNPVCNDTIILTGEISVEQSQEYDEILDRVDYSHEELLIPTCFNPPIDIFHIHKDIPEAISNAIIIAFNIYWLDIASCANKIRVIVELIMDDMKIPKTYLVKSKRKGYPLHQRIELFKKKKKEQAELLMAIKWIGNTGSHTSESLTKHDILDGFEILEHVTTNLYEKDSVRIKKLSKTINKRKKPIGKPKRRLK